MGYRLVFGFNEADKLLDRKTGWDNNIIRHISLIRSPLAVYQNLKKPFYTRAEGAFL